MVIRRRWILGAALAGFVAACSSSSAQDENDAGAGARQDGGASGGDDAAVDDDGAATSDSGRRDGGRDGGDGGNPGGGDGGAPPNATLLKAGDITIMGTTTDGYVLYSSTVGTTSSLEVVSLAGGAGPTVLLQAFDPNADYAVADGKIVAFWNAINPTTGVGALGIWSAAAGTKAVGAGSLAGAFYASPDGSRILYSTAATASTTSMSLGNPALNPASNTPITNMDIVAQKCVPYIGWVGNRLFAAYCTGTTTTATSATVRTIGPAASATTTVATAQQAFWASDTAGDKLIVKTSAGALSLHTLPATVTTAIDTGVTTALLTGDGADVLYRTTAMALKRATAGAAPNPTTLVTSGVRGLVGVSPDYTSFIAYSNPPDTTNADATRIDLRLGSATTAGALTALLAASTGSAVGFTPNGAYAVYLTDIGASGPPIGTLKVHGTAAGGTETEIAQSAGLVRIVPGATSTKVVYFFVNSAAQALDIQEADVAAGGTPVTLVSNASGMDITATQLVFTQDQQGLFVMPLP